MSETITQILIAHFKLHISLYNKNINIHKLRYINTNTPIHIISTEVSVLTAFLNTSFFHFLILILFFHHNRHKIFKVCLVKPQY